MCLKIVLLLTYYYSYAKKSVLCTSFSAHLSLFLFLSLSLSLYGLWFVPWQSHYTLLADIIIHLCQQHPRAHNHEWPEQSNNPRCFMIQAMNKQLSTLWIKSLVILIHLLNAANYMICLKMVSCFASMYLLYCNHLILIMHLSLVNKLRPGTIKHVGQRNLTFIKVYKLVLYKNGCSCIICIDG